MRVAFSGLLLYPYVDFACFSDFALCVGLNVASKSNMDSSRRSYKTGGVIDIHQNLGIER